MSERITIDQIFSPDAVDSNYGIVAQGDGTVRFQIPSNGAAWTGALLFGETSGFFSGGINAGASPVSTIRELQFASDTTLLNTSILSNHHSCCGSGHSTPSDIFVAGGVNQQADIAYSTAIDKMSTASCATSTCIGDVAEGFFQSDGGGQSTTTGYIIGGACPTSPFTNDTTQKYPFANASSAQVLGDIGPCTGNPAISAVNSHKTVSSDTGAYMLSGAPSPVNSCVFKLPFANENSISCIASIPELYVGGVGFNFGDQANIVGGVGTADNCRSIKYTFASDTAIVKGYMCVGLSFDPAATSIAKYCDAAGVSSSACNGYVFGHIRCSGRCDIVKWQFASDFPGEVLGQAPSPLRGGYMIGWTVK